MKKLLMVVLVLVVVAAIGLGIFIATFNADRYRPLVVEKLHAALGKPVGLERISLGWSGGIALRLSGLTISEPSEAGASEPIVSVESASAVVKLVPLLHKDVQISSIVLNRPRVHVVRDAQGRVNLLGPAVVASPAVASGRTATIGGAPVTFNVERFSIEDGTLRLTDAMATPPIEVPIERIDVLLRNISLVEPIDAELRCALFSQRQNVRVTGRVHAPVGGTPAVAEDVRLEADLGAVQLANVTHALPSLAQAGLRELAGELAVSIQRVVLDQAAFAQLEAAVSLANGRVATERLAAPIEAIALQATAKPGHLALEKLSAKLGGGTIQVTGQIDQPMAHPQSALRVVVEQLPIEALTPTASSPNQPQLGGRLSATFEGTAQGMAWPELSRTMAGQGRVQLHDGVVKNLNIVRTVFEKLSIIPGLVQRLESRLPASYSEKLNAKDTRLKPIDLPLAAQNGTLRVEQARIETDTAQIDATGTVGFDGTMAAQATLFLDPDLSVAIIASVKELQNLADANGRLAIPLALQGKAPDGIRPDLQYIASRLVTEKANELIGNLINKALEKNLPSSGEPQTLPRGGAQAPGQTAPPSSSSQPAASPLRSLLQGVLEQQGILPPSNERTTPSSDSPSSTRR